MNTSSVPIFTFLADGGETGALMRAHNWSLSPLGSPENWPQSLRSMVGMLLNSKFPMFIAWGEDLAMLYNDAYIEILGSKHPSAVGARLEDIWGEVWVDVRPNIEQAMRGQAVYGENLPFTVHRNGYNEEVWFTFSYSPVRDESGQVGGMFCAVMETTEQVLAQQHRADEITRLQRLFQHAPGIIAVLRGPEHIFDIANDGYCRFIGRNDSVGKPVRQALPELEGQGFYELLDQVYTTGRPYFGNELPIMLQREPNGKLEQRFVSFIYQPTFDHRGDITGIFVEGNDVTESVTTLRALQASERELVSASHRKDEFLAMLAHELRNPLAPIATAADMLKMLAHGDHKVVKAAEVIARQSRHLTALIDDLLDVSRVTKGLVELKMEVVDLAAIVTSAIEQARPLIQFKHQSLAVRYERGHPAVTGDRNRLVQVIVNLLNNATKYTQEGGSIVLTVDTAGSRVIIDVQDNGIGISPELQPQVFDLFTQATRTPDRSQGGLGIGLALVKTIVKLHGGEITVSSDGVGTGSRFRIALPISGANQVSTVKPC
ncbi:PAS domain-containing sensor histidine kinase [Massilia phyllosphaerae]|uniref:PAS domain-containing sensor histidine kinase n=1 Tax=Massilia phyllosphaerae TaxID=3106034 RepID=UPI002B1CC954|nr:ATP-binding protein [Massilia sp. SGZ-792]